MGNVEVVDQHIIALLADESLGRFTQEEGYAMSDGSDLADVNGRLGIAAKGLTAECNVDIFVGSPTERSRWKGARM
jgi:hypothetical protein